MFERCAVLIASTTKVDLRPPFFSVFFAFVVVSAWRLHIIVFLSTSSLQTRIAVTVGLVLRNLPLRSIPPLCSRIGLST